VAETRHPKFLEGWLASIQRSAIANLGHLREWPNVEVCEGDDQHVWLRGPRLEEKLHQELRSLLGCDIFRQLEDGQIVPSHSTLPRGHVPQGPWKLLRHWLTISLPRKRFPAQLEPNVAISLVRSSRPETPGMLRLSIAAWSSYARTAPQVRLERLQFAASHEQAIIVGDPLPPIHGDYFYLRHGVAVPVGFGWQPSLDARVLRNAIQLQKDDVAIFYPEGGYSVIRSLQFCAATRSAIRITAETIHAES